ncbi:DHS-like NAD/FAD-binding domain-containing protein [Chaetomium sp. MPI-SDFR-AT-0129]|nr:DHS-like NAD/FAD-binding domain-containing protein [Chaetomium sp. MPI-SDFR-AT-0129]
MPPHNPNYNSVPAFHAKLATSRRILAVCGAGLSASSGLATFRGAGGMWRNYEAMDLATPEAFERDPGLVWLFYAYRRHMALQAKPNAGHYALAELARRNPGFWCLSQNVDNLHVRADHPPSQLKLLHGSLFTLKCASPTCDYQTENYDSPLCPALAQAAVNAPASATEIHPLLDPSNPLPPLDPSTLPHCPRCPPGTSLLRPGVVWFGEPLDGTLLTSIDTWIEQPNQPIDIILVIGTSGVVWPAAGFAEQARMAGRTREEKERGEGASVVHVNLDAEEPGNLRRLEEGDFAFAGDAGEVLGRLLEPVLGRWEGGEGGRFVRE